MKKKLIALFIAVVMVLAAVVALVACKPEENKTTITVWVSQVEGVKTLTENQINRYLDEHADYKAAYTIKVEGVGEGDAASKMITDVASGADIYCFAQDQLTRLVQAGGLSKLGPAAVATMKEKNDGGSIKAATSGEDMYAYPITSDNGYFMYYDTEAMQGVDMDDLSAIVAKCEELNRLFSMELEGSAWYTASFFFGAGCVSEWTQTADGKDFESVNDDFNSAKGMVAAKGMSIILTSGAYNNSSGTGDFAGKLIKEAEKDADGNEIAGTEERDDTNTAAVVISGTWGADAAKANLGNKLGVAKLPRFEVNGTKYQMGSYSGNKLMGVKPHTDPQIQSFCQNLALYLSDETCQLERYTEKNWGPSNINAQNSDAVKADPILAAFNAQNNYATPQGNIHGSWWDIGSALATNILKANNDEEAIQAALDTYKDAIDALFKRTEEEKLAWGVVGTINSWGTPDIAMTKSDGEAGATVYTSEPIELTTKDAFKVRQGAGWDVQYGSADGVALQANTPVTARAKDSTGEGGNFTVAEAGTYKIVLTIAAGGASATVAIVPVEAE